ncbi:MAG TPA: autotransporter-associated beta strand repeat-containing protein [Pirellulales bacterium]|nr:autotransporter-associated beta strand repeat-containing protein [Pirellulales bacterium]
MLLLAQARVANAATDVQWNVAGPADWNTAANWLPATVPANGSPLSATNGANAHIGNGGTATITSAAGTTPTIDRLLFDGAAGGTVTQTSDTLTLTGLDAGLAIPATPGGIQMGTIALNAGATDNYNLNGTGAINAAGYVYIGQVGGATGGLSTFTQGADLAGTTSMTIGASRLEIGGGQGATGGNGLYILDSGTVNIAGNGVSGEVGRVGSGSGTARGELDINGGTFNASSDFYEGRGTGSTGLIAQTGGTANIGTLGNNLILGNGGTGAGTYNLSNGTLNVGNLTTNAGGIILGNGSGGIQTINISQLGAASTSLDAARLTVGAAAGTTGIVNQSGGSTLINTSVILANAAGATGGFNQSGGFVTVDNALTIGGAGGGTGSYTLSGTAANPSSLTVGSTNSAQLIMADGTSTGGTFTMGTNTTYISNGEAWIGHGATAAAGPAVFTQNGGTATFAVNAGWGAVVGNGANAGTYNLHGGQYFGPRIAIANNSGSGTFVQDNGSGNGSQAIVGDDVIVGSSSGPATYTISGPSSGANKVLLQVTGTGSLGSLSNANDSIVLATGGGTAAFNQNGGFVDLSGGNQNGVVIQGTGTYNLNGGILLTPQILKITAGGTSVFDFNGGLLRVSRGPGTPTVAGDLLPFFMGPGNPNLASGRIVRALTAARITGTANTPGTGAIIDTNGFANVNISQNLSHDPALGAALDGGLTLSDSNATPGSLILSGSNTYNGETDVTASIISPNTTPTNGLLILGSTLALGQSTLNMSIDSGPTATSPMVKFNVGVGSFTLGGLTGAAKLALPDSAGMGITLSVGANNQNSTYTGVLSDTGGATASGLSKVGTATFHLTAVQTYTGPTQVLNGTLSLNGASIAASSSVTVGPATAQGPSTLVAQNGANAGAVTVGPLGTFGAGDINIANANSLAILNSGTLAFTLGSAPNGDLIADAGALTLPTSGGIVKVNLADNAGAGGLGSIGPGNYKLITAASVANFTTTSFSPGNSALPGDTYIFTSTGTAINLQIVAAKSWTGGSLLTSNWSDAANWTGLIVPGSTAATDSPDTADFNAVSSRTSVVVDSATQNVRSITFESTASAYTVGSTGGNALRLSNGGTIQTTSAVANDQNVNAPLVLEGDNGNYTIASNSATNLLNIGGGITGVSTNPGPKNNTTLTLAGANAGANTLGGVVGDGSAGGTLSLFKTGAGTWALGGNNTFTGGVVIDAGTLRVGNAGALNSAANLWNSVTFTPLSTGTLALNGISVTVSSLNSTSANGTVVNGSASSAATLTVNSIVLNSYAGVLADGAGSMSLGLTLSSSGPVGSLTLLNANTFSGDTNVTGGGLLTLGNAAALQNSTLNMTVANSVQFAVGLTPFTLGGLKGPASLALQDSNVGPITLNIGNNNQSTQYDGVLSELGVGSGINKIGTGTLSMSQAPTYTGTTNVSAGGTLAFDPPAGPGITFSSSQITGPGVVAATGPGGLTLTNNTNSWSGGLQVSANVTVTAGPWATGAADPLGTGAVTLNSGSTLNLAGNTTGVQSYRAGLTVAGNSTVNVTDGANPSAATMGTARVGAQLNLTGVAGSSLTLGTTTLTAPSTVNPAANTTLTLAKIGETGGSQSLSMIGAGTLAVGTPGTYSGGTAISNGLTVVTNNKALGTNTVGMTGGKLQLGLLPKSAIGVNIIGNIGFNAGAVGAGSVPVGESAGVFSMANWNNANGGGAGGAGSGPITGTQVLANFNGGNPNTGIQTPNANVVSDNLGVPTAATIAYHTPANGWSITQTAALEHGNTALMNGYLDTTVASTAPGFGNAAPAAATTFSIAGLPYAKTDVYVYFGDFQDGGVGGGYLKQIGAGQPGSADKPYFGITNDANDANAAFPGFIQATAFGTTATTLDATSPALANSNYFFYPAVNTSAGGSGGAIDFVLLHDPSSPSNVGLHGIEFVDATPGGSSATLANALTITGNSTVDVTGGSAGGITGPLTIDSHTLFVTGGSSGMDQPYTLNLGNATLNGNPTFDVSNNGMGTGTAVLASLSTGGTARVITKANAGTLVVQGASTLDGGSSILVSGGTLRFANGTGAATIGAGSRATVTAGTTLELAGSFSDLSSPDSSPPTTAALRVHVVNSGNVLVSGTHQQVGAIDGPTGVTTVNAGSDLTADHIVQKSLVIGGTATSAALVTIAASDASGNPLASGFALAGSLAPSGPFAAGTTSAPSSLASDGSSAGSGSSLGGSNGGVGSSSVPEPSSLLLMALGSGFALLAALRRKARRLC